MSRAVISIGSNVDRERKVGQAVEALRRDPQLTVVAVSCIHQSPAVGGPAGLPDFYNVAVVADTKLEPGLLRKELRAIEERLGRIRTEDRYAPRTIDLDIALYDDLEVDLDGTPVPDPDLLTMAHLAVPIAQVAPNWVVPASDTTVRQIAERLVTSGVKVVPMHELPPETRAQFEPDAIGFEARANEIYDPELEGLIRRMLVRLGEDPDRDGLARTPLRVAKALDFLTSGYTMSLEELLNEAIFDVDAAEEMVILKDIEFYSMCEHHMLPFYGKAHIAYLPRGRVIGVSKMARLVDMFGRRLQVQERLTNQVADALMEVLQPHGAAVVMQAAHLCMLMRGVQKQNSLMVTSAMRGTFKQDARTRAEFMGLID